MRPELSVIIPAFNEEKRLRPTLEAFAAHLERSGLSHEIVVVDDGSTDDTAGVAGWAALRHPSIRCIRYRQNRGKGHAVRIGMLSARGAIRVMCDADGSTPPSQLPRLVAPLLAGEADIAIGSRYRAGASVDRHQPLYRRAWSRLANLVVRTLLVRGVRDTQCGFKAFSAEAARTVFSRATIDGWAFDLEALALARRLGERIVEVPIHWSDDPGSRISPVRDAIGVARELIAIRINLSRGVYGELSPTATLARGSHIG